tara:strand:- start:164 stop:634 length:471 start_codon:yes stop_codon:yes gene_type:complete
MYEFYVHTLVDITDNGNLQKAFPFQTKSGDVIHNKETLSIAKNQNSNFNTMLQLLQIRGNIVWEQPPLRLHKTLGNTGFGSAYEGKHYSWHFQFFTEQSEIYGVPATPTGQLIDDFNLVPVVNFCKETAAFPTSTFITTDMNTINTYFSYNGIRDK